MAEAYATPRNGLLGALADFLAKAKAGMNAPNQPPEGLPPVTVPYGDLALGKAPEMADDLSYGSSPLTGQGETTGLDPRMIDLASLMPVGAAGKLAGLAKMGGMGIIAGKGAATADLGALARSIEMMKAGKGKEEIFDATKWWQDFRRPEDWKFEVPDNEAKLTSQFTDDAQGKEELNFVPLPEAIDHKKAFAAYPQLESELTARQLVRSPTETGTGSLTGSMGSAFVDASGKTRDELTASVLHEMNHYVQELEGFGKGGIVSGKLKDLAPATPELAARHEKLVKQLLAIEQANPATKAEEDVLATLYHNRREDLRAISLPTEEAYRRLAGEAESRLVEHRFLNPSAKRPFEEYDRPPDQWLYRGR